MWSFRRALDVCASSLSKLAITNAEKTCCSKLISTNAPLNAWDKVSQPKKFLQHNRTMFAPLQPDEPQRSAVNILSFSHIYIHICKDISNKRVFRFSTFVIKLPI